MAEIDVLDARFGAQLNAAQISENPVGDSAAGMGDFAGQTVQAGGNGEVVKHMTDLATAFVVRPVFAMFFQTCVAHGRMISGVAVEKDVMALAKYIGMDSQIRPGCAI